MNPFQGRLLLTGAPASSAAPLPRSTVHGAYWSGERVARLLAGAPACASSRL